MSRETAEADRSLMARAIALAERGRGRVSPNPLVGALVVADGEVVGEGAHEAFGGPHAEVAALQAAGARAKGATLYVSLEPCAHRGKTPPCTEAILAAGVGRVVFAVRDPCAEARGGAETLQRAGVSVTGGILATEAARGNAAFLWRHGTGRPFVTLKLAVSIDGRIAAAEGVRTRLTGPDAEAETMRLRAEHDAVLVGGGTARVDDPRLTVRPPALAGRAPVRVVLDSRARLAPTSRLVQSSGKAPVLLMTAPDADVERLSRLEAAGVEIEQVPRDPAGGLDLDLALARLAGRGLGAILCEGGAELAGRLVEGGHVQRLVLLVAPTTLGPAGVPSLGRRGGADEWHLAACRPLGTDAFLQWDARELDAWLGGD
jgi:diaminohydroxyphosphoribosylaminopyrimidine deaminase/5-amino-6-(5-phosphoribosylamino)uracil reductase